MTSLPEFIAVEQVVFFVRERLDRLATLIQATDCIYEFDLAAPPTRDWLYSNYQPVSEVSSFGLARPSDGAPAVVVLDTGVSTAHPLLEAAIRGAISVLPGDSSPEDSHRHGTGMAGIALYGGGLGDALDAGQFTPINWIESARILGVPYSGTGAEEYRAFWPALTQDAILGLERGEVEGRKRAFALAITTHLGDTPFSTPWSQTIDQLAHNSGTGRLICVAAGNADISNVELIRGYPQLNLAARLHDPAQAVNALTVGAYTTKTEIPPEPIYAECSAVAPKNGISPYTRAGVPAGTHIKPDVVMEGGNVAFDGSLPSSMVETLSTLTTHPNFLRTPLTLTAMTSEATARAARLGAEIWASAPDLRPETVRGLIVHSASWTPEMNAQFQNLDERLAACGLGAPDPDFALGCTRDRATVIVEDSLPNSIYQGDGSSMRVAKFFALPAPEELADLDPATNVELRVTLSYLPEPLTFRQRTTRGLDMKWEMQGPSEKPEVFFKRINKVARAPREQVGSRGYNWTLGQRRRTRGTVQSDRYEGPAPFLAGTKYIAVAPVLGWWERRPEYRLREQRFSLIVTIQAAGSAIYTAIETALAVPIEVTV
ncbi:MAG TPA: S8 family peptidase [Thermoanaerobaculia bacterium]